MPGRDARRNPSSSLSLGGRPSVSFPPRRRVKKGPPLALGLFSQEGTIWKAICASVRTIAITGRPGLMMMAWGRAPPLASILLVHGHRTERRHGKISFEDGDRRFVSSCVFSSLSLSRFCDARWIRRARKNVSSFSSSSSSSSSSRRENPLFVACPQG